jgi:hypothetical protein
MSQPSKIDIVFHNLRNFPYWIILLPLFVFMVLLYTRTQDTKIYDMSRDLLIALTTSIGLGRFMPSWEQPKQSMQTESGDIINQPQSAANAPAENPAPENAPADLSTDLNDIKPEEFKINEGNFETEKA